MPTRTFAEWFGAIIESPIPVVGTPLAKLVGLETLLKDRSCTWDELLMEQLERAKKDPVFLSDAKSRAQEIYDRISGLEAVDDHLWPDD